MENFQHRCRILTDQEQDEDAMTWKPCVMM